VPALPSRLTNPLWDQFATLLPSRPVFDPTHPLGCHRRRIPDRIVFDKLLQVLRFACSYQAIADTTCSASTAATAATNGSGPAYSPSSNESRFTPTTASWAWCWIDRGGRLHHQGPRRWPVCWAVPR
jgi:hypothetical protein